MGPMLREFENDNMIFFYIFLWMSPTRSGYNELGLEPVEPLKASLAYPDGLRWKKKGKTREQEILSKYCSSNPPSDRGMP